MVPRRLLFVPLLVVPWMSSMAFQLRFAFPRQQQQQRQRGARNRFHLMKHYYNDGNRGILLRTTAIATTATTAVAAGKSKIWCRGRVSSARWLSEKNAGAADGIRKTAVTPTDILPAEEGKKCGPIVEAALTRSQALKWIASSVTMTAAGLLFEPRLVTAAEEGEVGRSGGEESADVFRQGGAAPVVPAMGSENYAVGPDEIGVLFGDGPIGIKIGENPLKASGVCRVYITEVLTRSQAIRQANFRAGLGVAAVGGKPAEKLGPKEVAELIRVSPRPVEIVFRDPEFLGLRLEAEADKKTEAVRRSKKKVADDALVADMPDPRSGSGGNSSLGELRVTQVGKKPTICGTRSKAGDLIEFRYSARLASNMSTEFDSSDRRGTGLPYAIVLGNGDVVKGLDLSLFDMCIGERRKIEVPARLAYGSKGSKVFGISPDDGMGSADLVFGVELVSINFRSDPKDQRDNFYVDEPCDAAAIAAGNASGQCSKFNTK